MAHFNVFPQNVFMSFVVVFFFITISDFDAATGENQRLYTQQEIDATNKLRPSVEKYLTLDYQKTDGYLLTFIRGSKFNLKKAETDMEKLYKARKENSLDTILDENAPQLSNLPYALDGFDKEGRPILILNFGRWNIRNYILAGAQAKLLRHYQAMYERATRKVFQTAKRTGKDINKFFYIADMQGYSHRTHACLGCLPTILRQATIYASEPYYFTNKFFAVNVPRVFQPVLKLVKAIITGIEIDDYDSDKSVWQKEILKFASPDQLPFYLGGTKKAVNSANKNATIH